MIKYVVPLTAMILMVATNSFAALDWGTVELPLYESDDLIADVETVMGLAIGGLVAIWGFRKVIKVLNRS